MRPTKRTKSTGLAAPTLSRMVAEPLEARTLLSALPYQVTTATDASGLRLVVNGTKESDSIIISQGDGGLVVRDGQEDSQFVAGSFAGITVNGGKGKDYIRIDNAIRIPATIYGGLGRDTILGGSGDDTIYVSSQGGQVNGRRGSDTILSVGAARTAVIANSPGGDSFWFTRRDQRVQGWVPSSSVNYIDSFMQAPPVFSAPTGPGSRPGVNLPEPVTSAGFTFKNFSKNPLFSAKGPSPDDITQGNVGDCYFLSVLAAVAKTDPSEIRRAVAPLGDGTYAVRFHRGGKDVFVRVDADLAVSGGSPAYAKLGAGGSTWVAVMEKAYAFFRTGAGTYASLAGGWMSEAFEGLGFAPESVWRITDGTQLLRTIQGMLGQGKAVTLAVKNVSGTPLITGHAYSVDSVITGTSGTPTLLRLRNPWGYDGAGNDGNTGDGYVTITAAQALQTFWGLQAAAV